MLSETLIPRFVPSLFRLIKGSEENGYKYSYEYGYESGYKSGGFHVSLLAKSLRQRTIRTQPLFWIAMKRRA